MAVIGFFVVVEHIVKGNNQSNIDLYKEIGTFNANLLNPYMNKMQSLYISGSTCNYQIPQCIFNKSPALCK